MNQERLNKIGAQVRIGGKGTARRKKKLVHRTASTDDKKLHSSLKKLNVNTIPGIEEVNMMKDDGTVIHFNNPKVQSSLTANTFAITGHAETKEITEMLPGILNQLGRESLPHLRRLAQSNVGGGPGMPMGYGFGGGIARQDGPVGLEATEDDDEDVPDLVENFDEASKMELKVKGPEAENGTAPPVELLNLEEPKVGEESAQKGDGVEAAMVVATNVSGPGTDGGDGVPVSAAAGAVLTDESPAPADASASLPGLPGSVDPSLSLLAAGADVLNASGNAFPIAIDAPMIAAAEALVSLGQSQRNREPTPGKKSKKGEKGAKPKDKEKKAATSQQSEEPKSEVPSVVPLPVVEPVVPQVEVEQEKVEVKPDLPAEESKPVVEATPLVEKPEKTENEKPETKEPEPVAEEKEKKGKGKNKGKNQQKGQKQNQAESNDLKVEKPEEPKVEAEKQPDAVKPSEPKPDKPTEQSAETKVEKPVETPAEPEKVEKPDQPQGKKNKNKKKQPSGGKAESPEAPKDASSSQKEQAAEDQKEQPKKNQGKKGKKVSQSEENQDPEAKPAVVEETPKPAPETMEPAEPEKVTEKPDAPKIEPEPKEEAVVEVEDKAEAAQSEKKKKQKKKKGPKPT